VLQKIPGISQSTIQDQLANLKTSGEYLAIIKDVHRELDSDASAELLAAADKADKEPSFDFPGVAQVLTKPAHVDTFRELVTNPGTRKILDMKEQSRVARAIVDTAKRGKVEVSSRLIREQFNAEALKAKQRAAQVTAKEEREWRERDKVAKLEYEMGEFSRHARGLVAAANNITGLLKGWPKTLEIPWTGEMRKWVTEVVRFATHYKEVLDHVK